MATKAAAGAAKTEEKVAGQEMVLVDPSSGELITLGDEDYAQYGADSGAGYENQTSEDISVPFLEILQAQSPEVMAEGSELRAGMFINRATGEAFAGKDGVSLIPVTTQHVFVEWVPREKGGGIVQTYQLDDPLVKQVRDTQPLGTYKHPTNENDLVETFYVYAILTTAESSYPVVMAFTSTRIKPYKDWMFRARSIVIPLPDGRKLTKLALFSHRYRMTTTMLENTQGKWYAPQVRFDGDNAVAARIPPSSDMYQAAKALNEDINAGKKQADLSTAQARDVSDSAPKRGDVKSEDAPY